MPRDKHKDCALEGLVTCFYIIKMNGKIKEFGPSVTIVRETTAECEAGSGQPCGQSRRRRVDWVWRDESGAGQPCGE